MSVTQEIGRFWRRRSHANASHVDQMLAPAAQQSAEKVAELTARREQLEGTFLKNVEGHLKDLRHVIPFAVEDYVEQTGVRILQKEIEDPSTPAHERDILYETHFRESETVRAKIEVSKARVPGYLLVSERVNYHGAELLQAMTYEDKAKGVTRPHAADFRLIRTLGALIGKPTSQPTPGK